MTDVTAAILQAERRRCEAMITANIAGIEALLDPGLYFCHATGAVDSRTQYVAKIAQGRIKYRSIEWPVQQVIALDGDQGLLVGHMVIQVSVDGTPKQLDNQVIMLWRQAADGWRVLAFQSTPLKA